MLPYIAFARRASDTTQRGFHISKNFHNPISSIELLKDQFMRICFLSDTGRIFGYDFHKMEFNEVFLKDGEIRFQKKILPFDVSQYDYILFSNDLQLCFGFCLCRGNILKRKSMLVTIFKSKRNLLDTDEKQVTSYDITFPKNRASQILHCDVSPNLNFLLVIYVQDKTIVCDFLKIDFGKREKISLIRVGQTVLCASFPFLQEKIKMNSLLLSAQTHEVMNPEKKFWHTEFNISETHCVIKVFDKLAVYSMKQGFLFTVSPKNDPNDFIASLPSIVEDTLHGTMLFYFQRTFSEIARKHFIKTFMLEETEMVKYKTIDLENFGIRSSVTSSTVRKLSQIQLFVSTLEFIYVIDPFKDVILRTFDLDGEYQYVFINSNSFGRELFAWCLDVCEDTFPLKIIDIEHSNTISLKIMAKRSVLSFFSISQLQMMNIPKNLKIELGII